MTKRDEGPIYDEVETQSLSDFISDQRCTMVKIDVEGAEGKVLQGALALLEHDRPFLFVELSNAQLARVSEMTASKLIRWMSALGYRCFNVMDGKADAELNAYDSSEIINVLFVPRS